MNIRILRTLLFFCCILLHLSLTAQWEAAADSIIPPGHRVRSIKVAKDHSIWIISSSNGYTRTHNAPEVHRSVDGGKSWTHTALDKEHSLIGGDISPIDRHTAYVALHTAGLYKTTDGGHTWAKVESYPYSCNLVHFFNKKEGWVYNGCPRISLVIDIPIAPIMHSVTKDGGKTWTHIGGDEWLQPEGTSLPERDSAEFVGTWFASSSSYDYTDEAIVVGMAQGTYWLSTDKGYNWVRDTTPLSELGLATSNITMKDDQTIMIASNLLTSSLSLRDLSRGRTPVSFTTRDGGNTWIEGNPGINTTAIQYIPGSDSIFLIAGYTYRWRGSQGTAITYDFGANWEVIDNNGLMAMDFIDKKHGAATFSNSAYWDYANGTVFTWNYPLPESPAKTPLWVAALIVLTFIFFAYFLYRYLSKRNASKKEVARQISKLEDSAIRAHINPHFIFNSLSAIQNLMNGKDKEVANAYLVHFSQLTRGVLKASVEDKIPLEEDIDLLKNYLELEKMRFGSRIEYSIQIAEDVDIFDTMVPPMIVQTLVENAIIHSLAENEETGAIKLNYQVFGESLQVIIEDSVKGIYQLPQKRILEKGNWLKSVGIGKTKNQLAQVYSSNDVKMEELRLDNGEITGTRMTLKIRIND